MSLLLYLRMAVLIYSEEILLTNNVLYKHEKSVLATTATCSQLTFPSFVVGK